MSHAAGKVRFDDGTVMCFDYYATTGHARTRLYVSMDEVYESWERPNDRFECSCGRHENVHLAVDYGNGIQWQGRACRHCMAITHGLTPYCEDVFTWDGLPDWWREEPAQGFAEAEIRSAGAGAACSPLWRSQASGRWYRGTRGLAGDINGIRCERCGDILERARDETGLSWIHHVAIWWGSHCQAALDFLPRKPLHTPTTIVVPGDNPDHPPMPLAYFMNGYLRHHERLSGMAGDRNDNKLLFP